MADFPPINFEPQPPVSGGGFPVFAGGGGLRGGPLDACLDGFDPLLQKADRLVEVPPPVVICPSEVEHINITLEKNQQCACKDCGKLFNSVWYLKQHAVKHSNDRPFKCKFCFKTYKFRSNLYQHKCPDRQKSGLVGRRARNNGITGIAAPGGPMTSPSQKRLETNQLLKCKIEANMQQSEEGMQPLQHSSAAAAANAGQHVNGNGMHHGEVGVLEEEEISYGLVIRSLPPLAPPMPPPPTPAEMPGRPQDCIRNTPMPYEEVEAYISANKDKLHACRKCRLHFPSEETLSRHLSAHNHDEMFMFRCNSCPQAFDSQRELSRHSQLHVPIGPWSCTGCAAYFRSNMALRRHIDQCRPCRYRPFDMPPGVIECSSAPIDVSSFIISEADCVPPPVAAASLERPLLHLMGDKEKAESGIGSSPESLHTTTPERSTTTILDEFEDENMALYGEKKKREEDEESGFRSRVNSVTQSCSPGSSSAFSSDGGSPIRKLSSSADSAVSFGLSSFGSGSSYGQKLFSYEQPVGGDGTANFNSFTGQSFSSIGDSSLGSSLRLPEGGRGGLQLSALPLLRLSELDAIRQKDACMEVEVLHELFSLPSSSVSSSLTASTSELPPPSDPLPSEELQDELPDLVPVLLLLRHLLLPASALSLLLLTYVRSRRDSHAEAAATESSSEAGGSENTETDMRDRTRTDGSSGI